jgi:hypothetical protein
MPRKPDTEDEQAGPPPQDAQPVSAAAQAGPGYAVQAAALAQAQKEALSKDGPNPGVALRYRAPQDDEPAITVPGFRTDDVTVEELLAKPASEILGALDTGVYTEGPAWDDLLADHKPLKAAVAAREKADKEAQK